MENETNHTAELPNGEPTPGGKGAAFAAETVEAQIATELAKVVGIDHGMLATACEFLGTLPPDVVAAMLKRLKDHLGEQLLPLLETMAHAEHPGLAEIGISLLGTIQSFKAAQLLADLNATHPDKKLRKEARKSLYKLKSIGIEVETAHKPLLGESKHTPYKALISGVDGTGSQLITLSEEMLAGDLHLLQVIANDEKGIGECYSRRGITKKMLAKFPETYSRETGGVNPMFVEADYAYALALVLEAEQLSQAAAQELPDDYLAMKAFFGIDQAQPVKNPVLTVFDPENLKNQPYFLRTSEELFRNPAFLAWLLPINQMSEYTQTVLDQEKTVLELSPQFQQERKEEVYQKIVDAHFGEDALKRLRRRLELMAYIFFRQNKEEEAKRALTAGLTFEGMPAAMLKTHPFLRRLILDSLKATQYVIEQGHDPSTLEREQYMILRNEEGELVVELVQEEE